VAAAVGASLCTALIAALGDRDHLAGLFTGAGLTVTAAGREVGESRFPSVDALVTVEIDSTPLGERLDDPARGRILAGCRDALAPWVTADGSLRFPFECIVVTAAP